MDKQVFGMVLAGMACGFFAPVATAQEADVLGPELAALRASTSPFHNLELAQAAGWDTVASPCVSRPGGGMGFHHSNPSLMGDTVADPLYPEILVYAPTPDGGRRLVATEWVVFRHLQPTPPVLFGQTFILNPHLGPAGAWTLHAWVWRHNPDGMFTDFNPKVSCDGA